MFLGIDTSNYTTSIAVYDTEKGVVQNLKQLLDVKQGQRGLRQSDAVFSHTVNLPQLIRQLDADMSLIEAVGVSTRPRDAEGSYMPCFLAGKAVAEGIAKALDKPLFTFSHQAGHIAAALYSAGKLPLRHERFIAFHFSGGTSEAVLCTPSDDTVFACEAVAASLDLKAGQAIDRAGVMLGLKFPAGRELDALARLSNKSYNIRPPFKGYDPSISGLENRCKKMLDSGESREDIARYAVDFVRCVVDKMSADCRARFGDIPLIYAGGVMSNSIISEYISKKFGGSFAAPEFSSDNAAGTAVLAAIRSGALD